MAENVYVGPSRGQNTRAFPANKMQAGRKRWPTTAYYMSGLLVFVFLDPGVMRKSGARKRYRYSNSFIYLTKLKGTMIYSLQLKFEAGAVAAFLYVERYGSAASRLHLNRHNTPSSNLL